jgi:hypothetical protein
MARLLVHVEGPTEERFVTRILRNHLVTRGYYSVEARIVGNARQRERRGGICAWPVVKREIVNHLREDQSCVATTMVDYYGLPSKGDKAWPGREQAAYVNTAEAKAKSMCGAIRDDLLIETGDVRRFVPFVGMHEFEGLLFSDCAAFARAIGRADLETGFLEIRSEFDTPEEINDSATTAPSKRIKALFSGYQKLRQGEDAVREIGLARIRAQCPLFDGWVKELEARAG